MVRTGKREKFNEGFVTKRVAGTVKGETLVKPAMLYGLKTVALTKRQEI